MARRPPRRIDSSIIRPGQVWELGGRFIPIWLFDYMHGAGLRAGDKLLVLSLHSGSVKVSRWGETFMIKNTLLTEGAKLVSPSHHEVRVGQVWQVNEYRPRGMSDYGPFYPLRPGDKFIIVSIDADGFGAKICRIGKNPQFLEQEKIRRYCQWIESPN